MPDCNSGIRVKFVGGGGYSADGYGYETNQKSSQMFSNEMLAP